MADTEQADVHGDESGTDSPESPTSLSNVSTPSPPIDPPLANSRPLTSPMASSYSTTAGMTSSSTPLGTINAARRPGPPQPTMSNRGALPQDLQARMKAFHLGRQGTPPLQNTRASPQASPIGQSPISEQTRIPAPQLGPGGVPAGFQASQGKGNKLPSATSNGISGPGSPLAQQQSLPFARGSARPQSNETVPHKRKKPMMTLSQMNVGTGGDTATAASDTSATQGSLMDKYSDYIDKKTGTLRFKGKATLTSQGVEFSSGSSFSISLDEVDTLDELGKGNYGTVYKVRHSRPRIRKPGQGLAGNKMASSQVSPDLSSGSLAATGGAKSDGTTGVVMAMKEMRLELDDARFAVIIMELDILHRCVSPFIVDFYGAFFQEGAVYICMEFMDGGSVDKLYAGGIPEGVLRKITLSTTMGLKALKDEHNIIHRDVKPTNILVNTNGQVKICDFGVSGNLVASIAKTNIGCQSYMAPERISSGGVAQAGANAGGGTYSVQSDIWSLGLTIIECALGQYPYPPETYDNIFSQLQAIVDGDPPDLPSDSFSEAAHDFVHGCLMKIAKLRPTYAMLLQHAWLAPLLKPPTISEEDEEDADEGNRDEVAAVDTSDGLRGVSTTADKEVADWVVAAMERRKHGKTAQAIKPALHAAPLDAVVSPGLDISASKASVT